MDYSLLLVIETGDNFNSSVQDEMSFSKLIMEKSFSQPTMSRNQIKHEDKVYHIGIIDYLQAWNLLKKIENKWKGSK